MCLCMGCVRQAGAKKIAEYAFQAHSGILRLAGDDGIKAADTIAESLEESAGRMFLHAYIIDCEIHRQHIFVGLPQTIEKPEANNPTQLVVK
jgi:hypothetical protein